LGYKYRALIIGGLDLAKKKAEKHKRELTKRQLSRWQQQKRRQRFILGSGILIIVAVLGVVGSGVYNQWYVLEYKPLRETVIEVNDTKFDMGYYIKMLQYYTQGMSSQYIPYMVDEVVKAIEQSELIRQEAMKLGISVSDEEVDKELKSYDPPLSKDYRDAVRTQMLVGKLSDEYFDKKVPISAEQRHIFAMFLESGSQASEVRAKLEAGEDFSKLAGELSVDSICKAKEGDLGWRPEGVLPLLLETNMVDEYAFNCEAGVLSQPIYDETKTKSVGYWLIKVLSRDEAAKTAQVKVMLLGNEQQASEVRARLEGGDDFATLAKELSQHDASKGNGGDFTVSQDMMSSAFNEFAFKSELNVLSQLIRDDTVSTKGGYWLVKVAEVDNNRQIEKEDRDLLKSDALNKWVKGLLDDPENKVKSYLDDEKKQWAIWHAVGG
jgi:parvulin-like peptidyl-prolyl isomerase